MNYVELRKGFASFEAGTGEMVASVKLPIWRDFGAYKTEADFASAMAREGLARPTGNGVGWELASEASPNITITPDGVMIDVGWAAVGYAFQPDDPQHPGGPRYVFCIKMFPAWGEDRRGEVFPALLKLGWEPVY